MSVKPITPDEVAGQKQNDIPDAVFEAFNQLIAANFSGKSAVVKQDEVVARIATLMDCPRSRIFDNGWLNVEEVYRAAGWCVEYDKPGYNEDYGASFRFSRKG